MTDLQALIHQTANQLSRHKIPFILIVSNPQMVTGSLSMISSVPPNISQDMIRALARPSPKAIEEIAGLLDPTVGVTPESLEAATKLVDLVLSKLGDTWSAPAVEKASPLISV